MNIYKNSLLIASCFVFFSCADDLDLEAGGIFTDPNLQIILTDVQHYNDFNNGVSLTINSYGNRYRVHFNEEKQGIQVWQWQLGVLDGVEPDYDSPFKSGFQRFSNQIEVGGLTGPEISSTGFYDVPLEFGTDTIRWP